MHKEVKELEKEIQLLRSRVEELELELEKMNPKNYDFREMIRETMKRIRQEEKVSGKSNQ